MSTQNSDQYTRKEADQRFHKLVGIALTTPPKTQKMMGKKGVSAQSKKRRKSARSKGG